MVIMNKYLVYFKVFMYTDRRCSHNMFVARFRSRNMITLLYILYLQQLSLAGALSVSCCGQFVELSFAMTLTSLSAITVSVSHSNVIKLSCVTP